jgi:hypothetical protein
VYFDDSVDLFEDKDGSSAIYENKPVLVVETSGDDITVNDQETSKLYVYYNDAKHNFELYTQDSEGEYTPSNKMRFAKEIVEVNSNDTVETEFATIEVEDTDLSISIDAKGGVSSLYIVNEDTNDQVLKLTLGGNEITETTGTLEQLGDKAEDAEDGDVVFHTKDVSTKDYDYMDNYGIVLAKDGSVEEQADEDEVVLSIPSERVYSQVTLSMNPEIGNSKGEIISDLEDSSKNLIVIGGSCVNAAAAEALGVSEGTCGADFTAATGVAVGQFLIKETTLNGKTAIVVAGYSAEDTAKAAEFLIENGVKEGIFNSY